MILILQWTIAGYLQMAITSLYDHMKLKSLKLNQVAAVCTRSYDPSADFLGMAIAGIVAQSV